MSVSSTSDTILQIQQILLLYYWFGRISGKTPCKKQPARKRKVIEDSSSESSDDDKIAYPFCLVVFLQKFSKFTLEILQIFTLERTLDGQPKNQTLKCASI